MFVLACVILSSHHFGCCHSARKSNRLEIIHWTIPH